jgi:hypothetical protein
VRYKWEGTWPAIPVVLSANAPAPRREPVKTPPCEICEGQPDGSIKRFTLQSEIPPDAPPMWVEKIYENLFEKILPLEKRMSLEFYDAAIFGYAYSDLKRELAAKLAAWQKLSDQPGKEKDEKENERKVYEWLRQQSEPTLDSIRRRMDSVLADWKLEEAPDYLRGFAYGIERQQREEGWTPSAATVTLLIYKTLLRHRDTVDNLIRQNATAREIGELITKHATKSGGMTYAEYFQKHANSGTKETFLKNAQKVFERLGLPLPPRGRPRRNSDTK